VAQAAAIEREGWERALRRSWSLTEGNVLHVLYFVGCIALIALLPTIVISRPFRFHDTTVVSFLIGLLVQVLVMSFTALATALLYFDLRARRQLAAEEFSGREQPAAE
jgi:hypothetical protein